jgi:outer membrane immunogenic protein
MLRKLLGVVGISSLLISAPLTAAFAADMLVKAPPSPVAPAYSWAGLYIGINGGAGGGQSCWNFATAPVPGGCSDPSGAVLGGQIGYNWQNGNSVLGLEAQADGAHLRGSNIPALTLQDTDHTNISAVYMGTARLGYAWNQALLYVKGGVAFVSENYFGVCNGITTTGTCLPVGFTADSGSETRIGGVVGGGIEYGLTQELTLGVEGDYLPLGTKSISFANPPGYDLGCGPGAPCPVAIKENLWLVTARLNWRFTAP